MNGREDSKQNDLFFLCSLIEYIGRQTKNERSCHCQCFRSERTGALL